MRSGIVFGVFRIRGGGLSLFRFCFFRFWLESRCVLSVGFRVG